jgi:hypothetical protein
MMNFLCLNLEFRNDVNGKFYSELSQVDKDLIRKRAVRAIVVFNDSDADVKYQIFERLNLGSVQLTPQELRNNTLRGSFNDLLRELAIDNTFRKLLQLRLEKEQDNMAYEEMVLRFFAYYSDPKRNELLEEFLTYYMKINKDLDEVRISELKNLFNTTIEKIDKYLGDKAFSICTPKANNWNKKSNRRVFDAEMLAFSRVHWDDIKITPQEFQKKLKQQMITDQNFQKSLKSDGTRMLEERIEIVSKLLTGAL